MLSSLKNRKSIRKYSNQKVTDKLLNELLEISFRASNTGNMQIYSVIVTRDEEIKKQFGNNVPKPEQWGGYLIQPDTFEFWQGRPNRLHDRLFYSKTESGSWKRVRLAP